MRNPRGNRKKVAEYENGEIYADESAAEKPVEECAEKHAIIGVDAVAAFFHVCRRKVCEWRACYADFPVFSNPNYVWETTEEDMLKWKASHMDLFLSKRELMDYTRKKRQTTVGTRWNAW